MLYLLVVDNINEKPQCNKILILKYKDRKFVADKWLILNIGPKDGRQWFSKICIYNHTLLAYNLSTAALYIYKL